MKRYVTLIALVLLSTIVHIPESVHAVSYPFIEDQREEKAAKGIREKGETVCLFQSGTEDVRRTVGIGDIIIVYREGEDKGQREVGKIKVQSYVGEDYIKAEVVEGTVQSGDVARKGNAAGLVISSGARCK